MTDASQTAGTMTSARETCPVNFTPAAVAYLKSLPEYSTGKVFYFGDKPSGCSGYSYVAEFRSALDYPPQYQLDDLAIYIALESLARLQNVTVDLVREGINRKLTFHNPNQQGMCGCGESFSV